jgi:hypothetical protein
MTVFSACCRFSALQPENHSNMISHSTCSYPQIPFNFFGPVLFLFYSFFNFPDCHIVLSIYTFLSARLCVCPLEIVMCMCAIVKIVNPDIICQKSVSCAWSCRSNWQSVFSVCVFFYLFLFESVLCIRLVGLNLYCAVVLSILICTVH